MIRGLWLLHRACADGCQFLLFVVCTASALRADAASARARGRASADNLTTTLHTRLHNMREAALAEYLDRHGVTAYMKDVVTLLLENRPASPDRVYTKVLPHRHTGLFAAAPRVPVHPADAAASQRVRRQPGRSIRDARQSPRRRPRHEADLLRLLRLLCVDCPVDVSATLLQQLDRTEGDPISFDEFSAAVRAALLYDKLFARARALFASCDPHGNGSVPRSVLQLATRHVRSDGLDMPTITSLQHERLRDANPDQPSLASPPHPSVAVRSELHRLTREAQWEVSQLQLGAGDEAVPVGPRSPLTKGGASGSPAQPPRDGVGGDEFIRTLFREVTEGL